MAEYIKKEALLEDIENSVVFSAKNAPSAEMRGANKIIDRIKCAPAADVVPVVRGRWVTDEKGVTYCGKCRIIDDYASVHNYCPNCGARMDGDANG